MIINTLLQKSYVYLSVIYMFKDKKITVLKSNKLNKATKQSLVQIWRKNYIKYELLETEFSSLKNEYEKKINELEINAENVFGDLQETNNGGCS